MEKRSIEKTDPNEILLENEEGRITIEKENDEDFEEEQRNSIGRKIKNPLPSIKRPW